MNSCKTLKLTVALKTAKLTHTFSIQISNN